MDNDFVNDDNYCYNLCKGNNNDNHGFNYACFEVMTVMMIFIKIKIIILEFNKRKRYCFITLTLNMWKSSKFIFWEYLRKY